MKKAPVAQQAAGEQQQEAVAKQEMLASFGGFNAIRGFMPDADNMNPARKAQKNVFLTDKRFADKRESLKQELKGWIELLNNPSLDSATAFADAPLRATKKSGMSFTRTALRMAMATRMIR